MMYNDHIVLRIDNLGRTAFPLDIREKMNIKCGDKFDIKFIENEKLLKMSKEVENINSNNLVVIDEFGKILIPKKMREALGIQFNDEIQCYIYKGQISLIKER